ncbi:MAG: LCP family protein [Actinobacteria bacterium]|nr:LCP family protein [Actinomycetota bacterium]
MAKRDPPRIGRGCQKPPPWGDHEPPPKRKRYWWRFLVGSSLIVGVTAAATATAILLYVGSIAHALSHNNAYGNKLQRDLASVEAGTPENILLLGSDARANLGETRGRSDTTIVVHLDPEEGTISMLSIPRDLKVEIPGYGVNKFNAAYSFGGPQLTLEMVKRLTGLPISHIVNVDFLGFARAVNALGCVYVQVDRRYYHSNVGVPPEEQYSEINIQPGYQRLCGKEALAYVRYRHTDTDIVRSARQQQFLSAARQQISIGELVFGQDNLLEIFTKYTTSDIRTTTELLEIVNLLISLRGASVREVHFPAVLGPSYVYSSEPKIHEAVRELLAGESGSAAAAGGAAPAPRKGGQHRAPKPQSSPPPHHHVQAHSDGLFPVGEAGKQQADAVRRHAGRFPVYYLTHLPAGAAFQESDSEEHVHNPFVYHLPGTDGKRHEAYCMVVQWERPEGISYFGLQAVRGWSDPPLLDHPSLTKTVGGREYDIYTSGGNITYVAWHHGEDTYWIYNSLEQGLTNEQMMGLARSTKLLPPPHHPKPRP